MKKELLALGAVGVAVCCLGACSKTNDSAKYNALNDMLAASYSQIEITVTDTFSESDSLESVFLIIYSGEKATVHYSVEQFVEISLDAPASTGAKTTLTGMATVEYDTVRITGDEVDLDFYAIANPSYHFQKNYFKNAQLTGNFLRSDVKNPSGFFGRDLDCSGMKVWATFFEVFYKLEISYISSEGNQVKYAYAFTL